MENKKLVLACDYGNKHNLKEVSYDLFYDSSIAEKSREYMVLVPHAGGNYNDYGNQVGMGLGGYDKIIVEKPFFDFLVSRG